MTIEQRITLSTANGSTQLVTQDDILCGRGKSYQNNRGNIKFLTLIKSSTQTYLDGKTSIDKSAVVTTLRNKINESGARFIKKDPNTKEWYVMSENAAHDKIGHSIRDMIARSKKAESKSSNNKSITARRKQQQKKQSVKKVCFEPICHRSNTFINHDITTALSMSSINLLTSAFGTHIVESDDNSKKNRTFDLNFSKRSSVCLTKMFGGMEDIIHDLTTNENNNNNIQNYQF